MLLMKSASLEARNYKYKTPFDVAIESRSVDAASAIISSDRYEDLVCYD